MDTNSIRHTRNRREVSNSRPASNSRDDNTKNPRLGPINTTRQHECHQEYSRYSLQHHRQQLGCQQQQDASIRKEASNRTNSTREQGCQQQQDASSRKVASKQHCQRAGMQATIGVPLVSLCSTCQREKV
jgi:hypothetical protein